MKEDIILPKKSINNLFMLLVICIAINIITGCAKPIELNSKWRDFEITIDGIDNEWSSATIYAEKAKVSLTLLNDNNYMYIRLYSRDRGVQMQMVGMGFTIWFDPDGGKNKTFGIHFPLGIKDMDMPMMAKSREENPEEPEKMIKESLNEMEMLGPGKDEIYRMSLIEAETQGINAMLGFSKGNLVYELKVPFVQDEEHLYAIGINTAGIDTSTMIGIGFETPELDREEMRKKMEGENAGGMPPGGGTGMPPGTGGMPGGMPGGRPSPGAGEMPERLNLWISVKFSIRTLGSRQE